jgi:hypothetical protein
MKRRQLVHALMASVAATAAGLVAAQTRPAGPLVQVWKDPNCGCCKDWLKHLESQGFRTQSHDVGNTAARKRLGLPEALGSCHTALVEGYVIEGHVPAREIQRLLKEKPKALGLAVPGMPIGSPGMDGPEYGPRRDAYQVLLVQPGGRTSVFASYPQA